jgi:HlyD family secretion protein
MKKKIIIISSAVVLVALAIAAMSLRKSGKAAASVWETTSVQRGDLSVTITATGELKPTKTVDVGTQVSGVIANLYADYNTHVKRGQVIAELDTRTLRSQASASNANLEKARVALLQSEREFNRMKSLFEQNAIAQVDFDNAQATYETNKANMVSAQVDYDRAIVNLNYGTITAPIDGIVISRSVDEGQTVAASFNTPTLFEIAEDLTKMKIEASIDEADIGQVKLEQRVVFNVDAFPDKEFTGKVDQVRLQPTEVNNVVTYTVVIGVSNPEMKLMPGMTANITIFVDERKDVLKVSTRATSFVPSFEILKKYGKMPDFSKGMPKMPALPAGGMPPMGAAGGGMPSNMAMLWTLKNDTLLPLFVKKGLGDGNAFEVSGMFLKEGDTIVTGLTEALKTTQSGQTSSPFMPTRPGGTRR